jgi:hypothetical protein
MSTLANLAVGLVALLHCYFLVLEMFFWDKPLGLRTFRLTPEFAQGLPRGRFILGNVTRHVRRCDQNFLPMLRGCSRAVWCIQRREENTLGASCAGVDCVGIGIDEITGAITFNPSTSSGRTDYLVIFCALKNRSC